MLSSKIHCVYIKMDATFYETKSFFVNPTLQGEKTLETKELSFLFIIISIFTGCSRSKWWSHYKNEIKPTHNEEEDILWKKKMSKKTTHFDSKAKLSDFDVRSHEGNTEEVSATEDLPIALKKGKRSCVKYLISQYICTNNLSNRQWSFIVDIDAKEIPTSVQVAMRSEYWTQAMKEEMYALKKTKHDTTRKSLNRNQF